MADFYGYEQLDFTFQGREAILVKPKGAASGKWMLKTEYFGAFPETELRLLERGYHLAYLRNESRWGYEPDLLAKADFAAFLHGEYGLLERCVPVGMSCGGLMAVYFAALFPERVSVLYLDAPVLNLLSCPLGLGTGTFMEEGWKELTAQFGFTVSELLSYRNHPLDKLPILIQNRIPVVLVYGDSDDIVPYRENGELLERCYRENGGILETYGKAGCGHHPHGLEDPTPVVEFIERYAEI